MMTISNINIKNSIYNKLHYLLFKLLQSGHFNNNDDNDDE